MSKPVITYLNREIKKVFPVLILGILYAVFMFGKIYLGLKNNYMDAVLSFAYPDWFSIPGTGDLFISLLCNYMAQLHLIFVVIFTAILVCRVFYLENRAEISDFLRILPVKEWQKLWMKVAVGETAILLTCGVFGIIGTVCNAMLSPGLQKVNSFFPGDLVSADSYLMLWQIVLLMFLGMSAIFLVLFVAQSCIHNMAVAFGVGCGVLLTPLYFSVIYESVVMDPSVSHDIPMSIITHYPDVFHDGSLLESDLSYLGGETYMSIDVSTSQWAWFSEKLIFLLVIIAIALAIIAAVSAFRWNIRESSNAMINSIAVTEFIFTGICIAVATLFAFLIYDGGHNVDDFLFWLTSGLVAAILLAIVNMVYYIVQKRRRGA